MSNLTPKQKKEINPPPKPKCMVKKTIRGWVNIYDAKEMPFIGMVYPTEKEADKGQSDIRLACVFISIEYKVEE